jgi:hypothetical protein
MNPFTMIIVIFEAGSQIPLYYIWFEESNLWVEYNNDLQSIINYILLIILGYMKQPTTGSGIKMGVLNQIIDIYLQN